MADSNVLNTNEASSQEEAEESTADQQYQNNEIPPIQQITKQNNILPMWGNKETMNLNHLVLENILQSPYYRNKLSTLKTFHEVVDEIYYNVGHLEPWEKGTRKTTGQTGMCGGVRGVGAGGVVSTPFCLLFKLFTMKLTRKQLCTLLNHADSPFIRGLGFMYVRFCQQPSSFWEWYEAYLEDDEVIDPKAGGGDPMTIGQMCKIFLTKLEWYSTLFPRIPVPVQKDIDVKMREHNKKIYDQGKPKVAAAAAAAEEDNGQDKQRRKSRSREASRSRDGSRSAVDPRNDDRAGKGKEQRLERSAGRQRSKSPPANRHRRSRSISPKKRDRSRSKDRHRRRKDDRSKSKERHHSSSKRKHRSHHRRLKDDDENGRRREHKDGKRRRHHRSSRSRSRSRGKRSADDKKRRSRSAASQERNAGDGKPSATKKREHDDEGGAEKHPPPQPDVLNESREEGELLDDGKN